MAFCLHEKQDEIKRNLQKGKKKGGKRKKRKKKKTTTVVNLMKETDLHCHAALVSVLRNLPMWISPGYSLDHRSCSLLVDKCIVKESETCACKAETWGFGKYSVPPLPAFPFQVVCLCYLAFILFSLKQKRWPET